MLQILMSVREGRGGKGTPLHAKEPHSVRTALGATSARRATLRASMGVEGRGLRNVPTAKKASIWTTESAKVRVLNVKPHPFVRTH